MTSMSKNYDVDDIYYKEKLKSSLIVFRTSVLNHTGAYFVEHGGRFMLNNNNRTIRSHYTIVYPVQSAIFKALVPTDWKQDAIKKLIIMIMKKKAYIQQRIEKGRLKRI